MSNPKYAVAIFLDPRFKLGVYLKTQDPKYLADYAKESITVAYNLYKAKYGGLDTIAATDESADPFFVTTSLDSLAEYLKESRVAQSVSPLEYWKINAPRFPILGMMARDYLGLQPTSKDAESAFSKGRRTMPYWRMRQKASTVRNQMLCNAGVAQGIFKDK